MQEHAQLLLQKLLHGVDTAKFQRLWDPRHMNPKEATLSIVAVGECPRMLVTAPSAQLTVWLASIVCTSSDMLTSNFPDVYTITILIRC
jgi:hypothetical protein